MISLIASALTLFDDCLHPRARISWPIPLAKTGVAMRLFAALAAIYALGLTAFAQTAIAQTPNCKSIADSSARLACYDKAAPSVAPPAAARSLASVPASKTDTSKYVDTIGAEDTLMNARLRNICRGC
jgi:hypothetical protein